jgi:hypothetical protein
MAKARKAKNAPVPSSEVEALFVRCRDFTGCLIPDSKTNFDARAAWWEEQLRAAIRSGDVNAVALAAFTCGEEWGLRQSSWAAYAEFRRDSRLADARMGRQAEAEKRKALARELAANLSADHKARGKMHCYAEVARQLSEILSKRAGKPVEVKPETVRKVYLKFLSIGNG